MEPELYKEDKFKLVEAVQLSQINFDKPKQDNFHEPFNAAPQQADPVFDNTASFLQNWGIPTHPQSSSLLQIHGLIQL